jgi:hypothetical protein
MKATALGGLLSDTWRHTDKLVGTHTLSHVVVFAP